VTRRWYNTDALIERSYTGEVVFPSGNRYHLPEVRATSTWDAERKLSSYAASIRAEGWHIEVREVR
jgi:hypothetical protein